MKSPPWLADPSRFANLLDITNPCTSPSASLGKWRAVQFNSSFSILLSIRLFFVNEIFFPFFFHSFQPYAKVETVRCSIPQFLLDVVERLLFPSSSLLFYYLLVFFSLHFHIFTFFQTSPLSLKWISACISWLLACLWLWVRSSPFH